MVNPLHFMFDQVIKTLQYYLLVRRKGYPDLKKPTKNRKRHGKRFYADHQSSLSCYRKLHGVERSDVVVVVVLKNKQER